MTTETPSFLDINIDDAQEMHTLIDGSEARLRIDGASIDPNKSDPSRFNLALVFVDPSDDTVSEIKMWLPVPSNSYRDDDPRGYNKLLLRWKAFYQSMGETSSQLDPQDLIGKEVYAIVGEEETAQYGKQNFVRRFVVRR